MELNAHHYIAEDGLMRLDEYDARPPFGLGGLPTVRNENGILFAAYYYYLLKDTRALTTTELGMIEKALRLIKHPRVPGLYLRNDDRTESQNSIDNYIGVVALSALIGDYQSIQEIIDYGRKESFFYNNVNPGVKTRQSFRHPAEIAWYSAAVGQGAAFPLSALFTLSSVFSSFQSLDNTSNWLLHWLHFKTIDLLPEPDRKFQWAKRQWARALFKHGGVGKIFGIYFTDQDHPIRQLSEGKWY